MNATKERHIGPPRRTKFSSQNRAKKRNQNLEFQTTEIACTHAKLTGRMCSADENDMYISSGPQEAACAQ